MTISSGRTSLFSRSSPSAIWSKVTSWLGWSGVGWGDGGWAERGRGGAGGECVGGGQGSDIRLLSVFSWAVEVDGIVVQLTFWGCRNNNGFGYVWTWNRLENSHKIGYLVEVFQLFYALEFQWWRDITHEARYKAVKWDKFVFCFCIFIMKVCSKQQTTFASNPVLHSLPKMYSTEWSDLNTSLNMKTKAICFPLQSCFPTPFHQEYVLSTVCKQFEIIGKIKVVEFWDICYITVLI